MNELITHFGIDWRLLLAQAVNFLILLVVLKKFAYGPILRMLKKRREEIDKGLKFTQEAERRLTKVGEEREQILKKSRVEGLSIVSGAENTAKTRKDEITREAAKKSETIIEDAKKVIAEEKAKMGEEVRKEAGEMVRLAIAKVLGKMPSAERDEALIKEALKELKKA